MTGSGGGAGGTYIPNWDIIRSTDIDRYVDVLCDTYNYCIMRCGNYGTDACNSCNKKNIKKLVIGCCLRLPGKVLMCI